MRVYLAITDLLRIEDLVEDSDILTSYVYLKNKKDIISKIPRFRNFILDSGVFTMINLGKKFNLDEYVEEYADFVRENNIRNYIELDVDQIIGVEKTRQLRKRLEEKVGWQSIPVWHTIRGKESFIQDCKDYNYIALGFFLTEGLPSKLTDKYCRAFINEAHKLNCRIHGLGFTKIELLKQIPFDSVDSSSWSSSYRYGNWTTFDKTNCKIVNQRFKNLRMKKPINLHRPSFIEWKKFQEYARNYIKPIW